MGANSSKQHAPLTFGYVNRSEEEVADLQGLEARNDDGTEQTDHVLANPHLYKLEMVCQNNCAAGQQQQERRRNSKLGNSSVPESVVVATKVDQECEFCRQSKRLSLVRRDLAKDLAYIDETYYPDVIHYSDNSNVLEDVLDNELGAQDGQPGWAKLTIGEVTPGRNRPHNRLTNTSLAIDLSGRSLIKLSPSIGYLDCLTKLDLSHNQMTSLPRTLGYLKNLGILDTSHNQLESVPDTISYLTKLTALNISHNNIKTLPPSIGDLPKLIVITANDNKLTHVPREIAKLRGLISLNVSNNPLPSLPAEIGSLTSLRKLTAENCEFVAEFSHRLDHDPPSLFELCAREAVRMKVPVPEYMSDHIQEYFGRVQTCSFCSGPFFDSFVTRGRFIERSTRQSIALDYKLCAAHWNSEDDRLMALFAPPPLSTPQSNATVRNVVNTDGLADTPSSTRHNILNRARAYSDVPSRAGSPALTLSSSTSSQLSTRSNSSSSLCLGSLKRQPSLPALPPSHSASSTTSSTTNTTTMTRQQKQRPRASSTASVTRRLAGFLSSSPSSLSNSFSSSSLRQRPWNASSSQRDVLLESDGEHPLGELASSSMDAAMLGVSSSSGSSTSGLRRAFVANQGGKQKHIPVDGGINADLLHVAPHITARDRSGTF
ncbi:hypothetical protein BDB00DRAFT_835007 [Zychaea mexicana]|uniref:uncharacterized protein n=1 Tax=Zychaea mexicana TaxID=64656 RepID=UPI0022FDDB79|nr:uncharacterized protein BDB00DRAFT_835007 [Zychaea mexicana]KAI9491059.1 hypothetical protein BDB00DRAFT_835007 [Zychaea mexicana]